MTGTKKKAKKKTKPTLRQRLRHDAGVKLSEIERLAGSAMTRVCEESNTKVGAYDLMRLFSGTQTKSLRDKLIGQLADEAETELENIYNNQRLLDLGEKPDGE